ncbi:MAG: hypothetical protein AAGF81_01610 [Pseudomonadota bacterium]
MTEASFTQFMQLEKQRLAKCCEEIDAQFELLTRERQTLVQIAEAIDAMQVLYDKTGKTIDDALDMRSQLSDHLSEVRKAAALRQQAPAAEAQAPLADLDQHVGWVPRNRYSSEF